MVVAAGLVFVLNGCAETSAQRMISANDHVGLANYYVCSAGPGAEGKGEGLGDDS